jgi:hypothetical protein
MGRGQAKETRDMPCLQASRAKELRPEWIFNAAKRRRPRVQWFRGRDQKKADLHSGGDRR